MTTNSAPVNESENAPDSDAGHPLPKPLLGATGESRLKAAIKEIGKPSTSARSQKRS